MSLGSMVLKFRQKYGHGLGVAYYRDTVRPKILDTRPITGLGDERCEIHVMTSRKDWLDLIWALKSFYVNAQRRYGLCIHDDGSLDDTAAAALQRHFPEARLIRRPEADARVLSMLAAYPKALEFRKTNLLAPKVFDFIVYLQTPRMMLLDSDVLFFKPPSELLRRIEDPAYSKNSVNPDVATAYTVSPAEVQKLMGFPVIERYNSGLGVIHRDSLRWDWIEEFLALPGIIGHFWKIEQTLYALCSCRYGVELLPEDYAVMLQGNVGDRQSRHYVGAVRHRLYGEGIRKLVKAGFLQKLAPRPAGSE